MNKAESKLLSLVLFSDFFRASKQASN